MSGLDQVRNTYDAVAADYAATFADELAAKPLDRALLRVLAERCQAADLVLDIGCGPGHVTSYLAGLGVNVQGVDISPLMIDEARRRFPGLTFTIGQLPGLQLELGQLSGAVLLYSIIHLTPEQRAAAFAELAVGLRPGGVVLVAFHIGDERLHVESWLGHPVSFDGYLLPVRQVHAELSAAGLVVEAALERAGYPEVETSGTRRCYLLASRPL